MDTQSNLLVEPSTSTEGDQVGGVLGALSLDSSRFPGCPAAMVLRTAGTTSIAALLEEGGSLREDRQSIERLKAADQDLPIIFIARTVKPRREMAIRRLGIHYFLAHPLESQELRLVLEVLVRAAASAASFERFFTR